VKFYPDKISRIFYAPRNAGKADKTNAVGTEASFVCGSFVRIYLEIDVQTKQIREAKFETNGCGFAIAAADVLAEKIKGKNLTELQGLEETRANIEAALGKFPTHRTHCLEIVADAFKLALTNFRTFQIEEFAGEKALICACFGVSEEEIENVINENQAETIEKVGQACNAGTGCGSCRMLIQEIIDAKFDIFN
jgi:NifU-like protein